MASMVTKWKETFKGKSFAHYWGAYFSGLEQILRNLAGKDRALVDIKLLEFRRLVVVNKVLANWLVMKMLNDLATDRSSVKVT